MRTFLLTAAFAAISCSPALADSLFVLQGAALTNGTTASGTIGINTTTGVVDSASITSTQNGTKYTFNTISSQYNNFDPKYPQSYAYIGDGMGNYFIADFATGSLVGYTGGAFCTASASCDGFVGGIQFANNSAVALQTGSAALQTSSVAQTPEPSSLIFLSTGLLGLAGVARRRMQATA